jgi:hypothetical protein
MVTNYTKVKPNAICICIGENIQWLAPLRHLPLFLYRCMYHCDVMTYFDHGIKIRRVEGL